jgi:hypothetical protein
MVCHVKRIKRPGVFEKRTVRRKFGSKWKESERRMEKIRQ